VHECIGAWNDTINSNYNQCTHILQVLLFHKTTQNTKKGNCEKPPIFKLSTANDQYYIKIQQKKLVIIGASNVCAVADSSQWRCSSETLKHLNRSSYINFTSITSTSLTPPKKSTILMFALLQQRFCRNFITFYKFWSMKKIIPRVGHTKKATLFTIKIFTTDYILYKEGSSRKRDEDQIMPRVKVPLPYRIQILFQDTIRKGWAKAKMAPVPLRSTEVRKNHHKTPQVRPKTALHPPKETMSEISCQDESVEC